MGEPFRRVEHQTVLRRQLDAIPLTNRRRPIPQIDDHVVNRATCSTNELRLRIRAVLLMPAAQRATPMAEPHVELSHLRVEAMLEELVTAPRPGKIPPVVFDHPEPNDAGPFQGRFSEFHVLTSPIRLMNKSSFPTPLGHRKGSPATWPINDSP